MGKRYKPKPRYKMFTAYWWNPFFWFAVLISFPWCIVMGLWEGLQNCGELVKEIVYNYDLK
jgi:hypothetical protein